MDNNTIETMRRTRNKRAKNELAIGTVKPSTSKLKSRRTLPKS